MLLDCGLAAAERIFINFCLFVNVSGQFIFRKIAGTVPLFVLAYQS